MRARLSSIAWLPLAPLLMASGTPGGNVVPTGQLCTAELCVGDTAAGSLVLDGAQCSESYASLLLGNFPDGVGELFVRNGAQWTATEGLTIGRRGKGSAFFESGAQVSLAGNIAMGLGDMFDPSGANARGDLEIRGASTNVSACSPPSATRRASSSRRARR